MPGSRDFPGALATGCRQSRCSSSFNSCSILLIHPSSNCVFLILNALVLSAHHKTSSFFAFLSLVQVPVLGCNSPFTTFQCRAPPEHFGFNPVVLFKWHNMPKYNYLMKATAGSWSVRQGSLFMLQLQQKQLLHVPSFIHEAQHASVLPTPAMLAVEKTH